MNVVTKTITLGDGRTITIETGKLAKQADGSVVVRCGNMMLLATVVANKDAGEGVDFLPLTVDYKEKFAAVGRIPGGFFRREARPSEREILVMRIVDRGPLNGISETAIAVDAAKPTNASGELMPS
jgi:polyribonucleotide nucleotidyltransferase